MCSAVSGWEDAAASNVSSLYIYSSKPELILLMFLTFVLKILFWACA